jgi:enamine deaminase RidA (YjgF/YER057c/UK114 family)
LSDQISNSADPRENPFSGNDQDRAQIWEMLVERDINAFVAADWSVVENDFLPDGFIAIDAAHTSSVGAWGPKFDSLDAYKTEWISQARDAKKTLDQSSVTSSIFALTKLTEITINGDFAVARKCFDGSVKDNQGVEIPHHWQTLYFCRKPKDSWKISGFLGYLPYPLVGGSDMANVINVPKAEQHTTAGPYSPVVEIKNPGRLVVISGQAAIDMVGDVVGSTIEEQTKLTLENCALQLGNAGCSLSDVFKVNVYMTDLEEWPLFNEVYRSIMSTPYPTRAAVQTGLLDGLKVEIEMWAATK